jgi:hypothetical protein
MIMVGANPVVMKLELRGLKLDQLQLIAFIAKHLTKLKKSS